MITMERLSINNGIDRMLDKETIGKWIGELKLPLAIYLRDNLKSSGPNWFETGVIEKIKSSEMKKIATKSRDIKSLDEKALLEVFLGNWWGLMETNNIPRSFEITINRMMEIRHKYIGHEGLIIDIHKTGYKDLDTLIEFAEEIKAERLKEKFEKERKKEIIRLGKEYKSRTDDDLEPIESKEKEAEVLSVSAAETIHLIENYLVHSCPSRYNYTKTDYITFRLPPHGEMNTLYEIQRELSVPSNVKNNLEYFNSQGLTLEEMERLRNYIDGNPFTKNDRFYLLSRWKTLPKKLKPIEYTNDVQYYSIDQLLSGS